MIDLILQFFKDLYEGFLDFLKALVNTLFDMFKDLFYWLIDTVLGLAMTLLSGITGNIDLSLAQYFTALPQETRDVVARIGFVEAVAVVGLAIVARMLLQLIPFTRLGS